MIKLALLSIIYFVLGAAKGQNRDFYKILDIQRTATPADIKKAYRAASLRWHPDKNPDDPKALEKFTEIASAYEVLSDADKRKKYDRCGEDCVNEPENQMGSPFDIFGDIFG